jgi:hypothetical protein
MTIFGGFTGSDISAVYERVLTTSRDSVIERCDVDGDVVLSG